ncbi:hypothetical protein [Chromatium okenii]|uniref:hypothetical protein n=1 Tax=Chromatium okenii TaxID=61644 RepID=UPI001F5B558F|nr:hypothetical protein [Chromatium okenii]
MDAESDGFTEVPLRHLPSPWLGHLLVFGLLFALVFGWFFVQTRQAQQVFLEDASARARLLTDAVMLHTRGALLAERVTADILTRFLGNSARFVAYLDGVAPFRADELSAFADEAGLSVIRLIRAEGIVQGPQNGNPRFRRIAPNSINSFACLPYTLFCLALLFQNQAVVCWSVWIVATLKR